MEVELLKKYGSVSPGKIENLDGTTETVDFRFSTAIRFYRNMEDADFPLHWHAPWRDHLPHRGYLHGYDCGQDRDAAAP